jgi:hypothetical protein
MKKFVSIFCLCLPLFCMAQNPLPRQYDYDAAGNRILRKTITMPLLSPPAPPDSTVAASHPQSDVIADLSRNPNAQLYSEYFVENISQVEIKIYPNPTTEKITLEILNIQNLSVGNFKLYSLNGQLLQERTVHSITTEVSLAGLSNGAYILKVQINDRVEDWKIIKQ